MSDAQLQSLRRTWQSSRGAEDAVAYVREAQRTGALDAQRVVLAAHCEPSAAIHCLGLEPAQLTGKALIEQLKAIERDVDARVCAAVGRAALDLLGGLRDDTGPCFDVCLIERACVAVERWIVAPNPDTQAAVAKAAQACHVSDLGPVRRSPHTAWLITQPALSEVPSSGTMAFLHTSLILKNETNDPNPLEPIRPVLAREVAPWLLNLADPLRARHGGPDSSTC